MNEGRATRSRRRLAEQVTIIDDPQPPSKRLHLADDVVLTPPPSLPPLQLPPTPQPVYETRRRKKEQPCSSGTVDSTSDTYSFNLLGQGERRLHLADDVVLTPPPSQPPITLPPTPQPACETRRGRREKSNFYHPYLDSDQASTSSSMRGNVGSVIATLDSDNLVDFHHNYGFDALINADVDPILYNPTVDNDDTDRPGEKRPLDTPTASPRHSIEDAPTPLMRPDTPTPRPSTPGGSMQYIDGEDELDATFETSSFVGSTTLAAYGPPPTPACPPLRVGPFSYSSLFAHMPDIPIASTSASAALIPVNILSSSDDEEKDKAEKKDDEVYNTSSTNNKTTTQVSDSLSVTPSSPDITHTDPLEHTCSYRKHLQRLKIRAPVPRSCPRSRKQTYPTKKVRSVAPHFIKTLPSPSSHEFSLSTPISQVSQKQPPPQIQYSPESATCFDMSQKSIPNTTPPAQKSINSKPSTSKRIPELLPIKLALLKYVKNPSQILPVTKSPKLKGSEAQGKSINLRKSTISKESQSKHIKRTSEAEPLLLSDSITLASSPSVVETTSSTSITDNIGDANDFSDKTNFSPQSNLDKSLLFKTISHDKSVPTPNQVIKSPLNRPPPNIRKTCEILFKKPFPAPRKKLNFLTLDQCRSSGRDQSSSVTSPSQVIITCTISPTNKGDRILTPRIIRESHQNNRNNSLVPSSPKVQTRANTKDYMIPKLPQMQFVATTDNSTTSPYYNSDRYNHRKDPFVRDGNIVSIELTNFMAHRTFYHRWNPNVNFINGENGSGKSAILTALLIVFGGKASITQRCSSLKGLIKTNCASAEIQVRLTNYNGTVSKKVYGEEIILSRKLKHNGGAMYQIGTAEGGMRKLYQQELSILIHSLQIDPNNPVQFLKQDGAGESASAKGAPGRSRDPDKDRYKKFKDATQLTLKQEMLSEANKNLESVTQLIEKKEEILKDIVYQTKLLKEQKCQITKLEKSENILLDLQNELNWSKVKEKEDEQKEVEAKKDQTYLDIKGLKEEKKQIVNKIAEIDSMIRKNQELMKKTKEKMDLLLEEREDKLGGVRDAARRQNQVQIEINSKQDRIKGWMKDIKNTEAQMIAVTENYEEKNQKCYAEIKRCQALLEGKLKELEDLSETRDKFMSELSEFRSRQQAGFNTIKRLEAKLKQTKQELSKSYNFGPQMKELLKRIEEVRNWKTTPIGPLGAYVQVKDPRYAPLIERIMFGGLFTFVVQNSEDFHKLKQLIAQVYNGNPAGARQANISIIPNINVNEYMPKLRVIKEKLSRYRTMLSMLTIKNPFVEIGLIENTSCERIILFDDVNAANEALIDSRKVPPEVINAYTLDWFKVNLRPFYQYHPLKPVKRTTEIIPMSKMDDTAEVQIKADIKAENEVLETCRINLKGDRTRPGLEHLLAQQDENIQSLNKEILQLRHKIKSAQSSIKEVAKRTQDKDNASEIKMVSDMKAEMDKDIQAKKEMQARLDQIKGEIKLANAEKDEIDRKIKEFQAQNCEIEREVQSINRNRTKLEKEMDGYTAKIARLEQEFDKFQRLETKLNDSLALKIKEANACGERPETLKRDPEKVERELVNLKEFLEKNKDKLKSKKRVHSEYKNSKALVDQITFQIQCIKSLCKRLEPYIKVGEDCYEKMKKNMGNLLQQSFVNLVIGHGLTGGLLVDDDAECIVFYVSPDKQSEARAKKNYKIKDGELVIADKKGIISYYNNLSGGERSKALVFFIMAMWQISNLPFHCLDEFEANLDVQARGGLHTTLMKHAMDNPDAQFFIMTPLSLGGIPRNDPFISILFLTKRSTIKKAAEDAQKYLNQQNKRKRKSERMLVETPDKRLRVGTVEARWV